MGAQRTKKEAEQPRRRKYRLNKKKFLTTLFLFVCFAAVITVAIISLENAGNFKALLPQDGIPIKTEYNIIEKTQTQTANSEDILDGRIIVIDPGHGGFDPGAISDGGTHEAEINLKIAQYLKAEIDSLGAQVIMTREDDSGLGETQDESLQERRRIIEQSGSDIVVSIHINSHKEDVNVSGPLVLFMPGSQEGKSLAEKIQMHLNAVAEVDGTARSEELYVLKSGNQPCVLVECGYISNVEEEAKLCQADYQQRIAESICEGIKAYFS